MKEITRGFIAKRDKEVVELKVAISNIAFVITTYQNHEVLNQLNRVKLSGAIQLIDAVRNTLINSGYEIQENKKAHKIREKGGFYVCSL